MTPAQIAEECKDLLMSICSKEKTAYEFRQVHQKPKPRILFLAGMTMPFGVVSPAVVSLAHPLLALEDKHHKRDKHDDDDEDDDRDRDYGRDGKRTVLIQVVFAERDQEIIRDYCSRSYKRGGQLPPGLEKHLRRNGQLPPGLQKKVKRFPKELERCLPPLPRNYFRVFVGGRGLIVDAQFNVLDVIDIFR
jgi:hypothetical protein